MEVNKFYLKIVLLQLKKTNCNNLLIRSTNYEQMLFILIWIEFDTIWDFVSRKF